MSRTWNSSLRNRILCTIALLAPLAFFAPAASAATGHPQAGVSVSGPRALPVAPSPVMWRHRARPEVTRAVPFSWTVRRGDTLSSIAHSVYHHAADWPVLWKKNHIRWASIIEKGQHLTIPPLPAHIPAAPRLLAPPPPPPPVVHATATLDASSSAPVAPAAPAPAPASYSGGTPGGSFGACVVAAESGGHPNIWNASGHWGLYQFSEATWEAYGGSAADFGSASVAEQNQVFANALAQGGQDNWSPYDGCTS